MAKMSSADLLEAFKEMTLLELSEFVKQFEETFDVKAAAPVAVTAPALGGPGSSPQTRAPGNPGRKTRNKPLPCRVTTYTYHCMWRPSRWQICPKCPVWT